MPLPRLDVRPRRRAALRAARRTRAGFRQGATGRSCRRASTRGGRFCSSTPTRGHSRSRSSSASCRRSSRRDLDVDDLVFHSRVEFGADANWKMVAENFLECYHCATAHPAFSDEVDVHPDRYVLEAHPTFGAQFCRSKTTGERGQFHLLYPNTGINVFPGPANLSIGPMLPNGPNRTERYLDYFFDADVDEGWRRDFFAFDDQVGREDRALVESVQRGVSSGLLEHGRLLLDAEPLLAAFQGWVRAAGRPRAGRGGSHRRARAPPPSSSITSRATSARDPSHPRRSRPSRRPRSPEPTRTARPATRQVTWSTRPWRIAASASPASERRTAPASVSTSSPSPSTAIRSSSVAGELERVHRAEDRLPAAALDPRRYAEVVEERGHLLARLLDHRHEPGAAWIEIVGARECPRKAVDGGERRPQVVAGQGDEAGEAAIRHRRGTVVPDGGDAEQPDRRPAGLDPRDPARSDAGRRDRRPEGDPHPARGAREDVRGGDLVHGRSRSEARKACTCRAFRSSSARRSTRS